MRTPYYYLAVMSVLATACGKETKDYDATGTFEATEVVVSAKSTGELRSFAVREGEMVLFDSVVGSIDARAAAAEKRAVKHKQPPAGCQ